MNRNRAFLSLIASFLAAFLGTVPAWGQQPGERIRSGAYSLQRAPAPENFVIGIVLPELANAHFPAMAKVDTGLSGRWGRYLTLFQEKEKKQVRVTVAVYGRVAEAEDAVLDLLNETSDVLKPGSRSGGVIGTHSWYLLSPRNAGTVVLTYNNSLVQVFSSDYSLAERSARAMITDLRRGTNGVRLGKQVLLPRVTGAEFLGRITERKEVALTFSGQDPYQQKLSFVASAATGQFREILRDSERIYVPPQAGTDEVRIYAINEMAVVSQVYVQKIEVEREKR